MPCPLEPRILDPISVFRSLFGKDRLYHEIVELLKETIENHKATLNTVDLTNAHLQGAMLSRANLQGAILAGTDLQNAALDKANLKNAILINANLEGATLLEADLRGARANLPDEDTQYSTAIPGSGVMEYNPPLHPKQRKPYKTLMIYPDLLVDDLCKAKTLHKAKLDDPVKNQILEKKPDLLKNPFPQMPTGIRLENR